MYKVVLTEIVKDEAEDKAFRAKQAKRFQELGLTPFKEYRVVGREGGMVFVEGPVFASWQEAEQGSAKLAADEEMQKLERERSGKHTVEDTQWYILTGY
jgi:hypothetical protein